MPTWTSNMLLTEDSPSQNSTIWRDSDRGVLPLASRVGYSDS